MKAQKIKKVAFFAVSGGVLIIISLLMAGHLISFPLSTEKVQTSLNARGHQAEKGWEVIHILSAGCKCSARVIEELSSRSAIKEGSEVIYYIGEGKPEGLAQSKIHFEIIPEEMAHRLLGVEAAPTLLIRNPEGKLDYAGGYAKNRNAKPEQDSIIRDTIAGNAPKPLPIFGCAFTKNLKSQVDPFGLKY